MLEKGKLGSDDEDHREFYTIISGWQKGQLATSVSNKRFSKPHGLRPPQYLNKAKSKQREKYSHRHADLGFPGHVLELQAQPFVVNRVRLVALRSMCSSVGSLIGVVSTLYFACGRCGNSPPTPASYLAFALHYTELLVHKGSR